MNESAPSPAPETNDSATTKLENLKCEQNSSRGSSSASHSSRHSTASRTTSSADIIESAATTLRLFRIIAADFVPRRLGDIESAAAAAGLSASKTSVYRMLNSLVSEQLLTASDGFYSVAPEFVAYAVRWQQHLASRFASLRAEMDAVQTQIERTTPHAETND